MTRGLRLASVVYIVDDDVPFHTDIRQQLELSGYQVQLYSSAKQFLGRDRDEGQPGCILVDASISGPTMLQAALRAAGSMLPVVFVSAHQDTKTVVQTIKAGAEDFLAKPVTYDVLLAAIERAVAQHHASIKLQSGMSLLRARIAMLTPRERQVFDLVVRGKTNKSIGLELGVTERTIKAHRQRVVEKLDARTVAELVMMAERLGRSAL